MHFSNGTLPKTGVKSSRTGPMITRALRVKTQIAHIGSSLISAISKNRYREYVSK